MSSLFGDIFKGIFSSGISTTYDISRGKYGDDLRDPGHLFTKSDSEKLAEEQWKWQQEKYDENFLYQKANDEYQKELNTLQMEREDNAVQRRVADLKAAGLSPTLAAGSSASATPVHAGNAPQYEVGTNPKLEAAMFKEQIAKDRMALAMTLVGNIADLSRTKAETEMIKAKTGEQDIINKYIEKKFIEENKGLELDNAAKNMANNFNALANPARLHELRMGIDKANKELKILDWDEKIKTNEALRQIYYNQRAKFEAVLAGKNVELADLRKENIDYDTALKAYSLVYASEHGVPLSGMNDWQAIYNLAKIVKDYFNPGDRREPGPGDPIPPIKLGDSYKNGTADDELLKYLLSQ